MKVLLIDAKEVERLKGVVGTQGSLLNPTQDADGNWFISYEELTSPEFAKFFQQDAKTDITDKLVEVDYKRPIYKTLEETKETIKENIKP
jgi:hypothetical protein